MKSLNILALLITSATLLNGTFAARASKGSASKSKGKSKSSSVEDAIMEWRSADEQNLRLSDGWLTPLYATSPTSLIVWSRHFDKSDSEGIVSKLGEDVKESEALWFWVQAIFIPHYPLYNMLFSTNTTLDLPLSSLTSGGTSYMTMLITGSACIGVINDIIVSLCFFTAAIFGLTGGFHRVQMEGGGLLLATITYYALWPLCSHSALLKISMYILLPLNMLIMLWSILTSTKMIVGAIAGTRDMRVGEMFLYRDHWCVPGPKEKQM